MCFQWIILLVATISASCINEKKSAEEIAVFEIDKLGGYVTIDEKSPTKSAIGVELRDIKIGNPTLRYVEALTDLQFLYLGHTRITDSGLVRLQGLKSLQFLDLQGTNVTDAGLKHLKGLTNLRWLQLGGNQSHGCRDETFGEFD